jgi:hypothetical protein
MNSGLDRLVSKSDAQGDGADCGSDPGGAGEARGHGQGDPPEVGPRHQARLRARPVNSRLASTSLASLPPSRSLWLAHLSSSHGLVGRLVTVSSALAVRCRRSTRQGLPARGHADFIVTYYHSQFIRRELNILLKI